MKTIALCLGQWLRAARNRRGIAALEFAAITPVLLLILVSIIYISVLFNNYLELTNAVSASARMLAASRGSNPPAAYSNATTVFLAAIPNLTQSNPPLSYHHADRGHGLQQRRHGRRHVRCVAERQCRRHGAVVRATYVCNMTFMGINFVTGCSLSAQTAEPIL